MRLLLLWVLTCCGVQGILAQAGPQVVYGERFSYFTEEDRVLRVYLDREGSFYPEALIPDTALLNNQASLRQYYAEHPDAFLEVATQYGLSGITYSDSSFQDWQARIVSTLTNVINRLDERQDLFLLIHGFRKPLVRQQWSSSSQEDYARVRRSIEQRYGENQSPQFVEVYWDGTFDCCIGRKAKVNKRIFQLFEQVAQLQATRTGYALRRLVAAIEREELTLVTHSLGAQVGVSLLSNTYDERIDPALQSLPTPPQSRVNICLVAPAISYTPFTEYHERTSALDLSTTDNYHLSVLYNKKDFVLRKRFLFFGPGPRKYGNTALGCNCRRELDKMEAYFLDNFPNSPLQLHEAAAGRTHRFRNYVETAAFSDFLELGQTH